MLSLLFLAKSTGFVATEQKLFCANFCYLTLSSVCWNHRLNFAKFFTPWSCFHYVLWLQSRLKLFYGNFLLPDSVERVLEPGLNFAKIFTPWSCLHCVLWLQSRSCFAAIFVTWLCWACVSTRGLISLKFSRPGLVYAVFCGSGAEVVLLQFLLPDFVERVLEPGA